MLWAALAALILIAALVWAHDFLEGEHLFLDLWYEHRLARSDIAQLDRQCRSNPRRSQTIVTLTTIPSRLPLIDLSLKSLLRQTVAPREIRLHLPRHSRREDKPYEVPGWLRTLHCVRIVACEDQGPATKLLPALGEAAADQTIVVVDDDRIYPPAMLEELDAAAAAMPDAAFGFSGWCAPADLVDRPTTLLSNIFERPPAPIRATRQRRPRLVNILQGMSGYLVKPRFFDRQAVQDYSRAPDAAFFVDDVWIGAHCAAPKYVIPSRRANFLPYRRAVFFNRTSLGYLNRGGGDLEKRNNTIMLKHFGRARWTP
ncbi:MAG TPA: hypothetical protein VGP48_07560 [Stellaceae bacterium]|jgi:hypothetical protein|nr:hypothetical protein [Stellaceae bacterium]